VNKSLACQRGPTSTSVTRVVHRMPQTSAVPQIRQLAVKFMDVHNKAHVRGLPSAHLVQLLPRKRGFEFTPAAPLLPACTCDRRRRNGGWRKRSGHNARGLDVGCSASEAVATHTSGQRNVMLQLSVTPRRAFAAACQPAFHVDVSRANGLRPLAHNPSKPAATHATMWVIECDASCS
jgi:hypothetical protein